jgi:NAD+ diphosphatase
MTRPNVYSGAGLDRADHLRGDAGVMERILSDPATRFVAVWRSHNLVSLGNSGGEPAVAWLSGETALALAARAGEQVFLGLETTTTAATAVSATLDASAVMASTAYVALDFSDHETPQADLAFDGAGEFRDLREVGPLLPQRDGSILAYARGLMHWHQRHRFCGACGDPTESRKGGHLRVCTRPACGLEHFPRTDPAVIMLVHDGEACVLGRRPGWPPGMHSTLAGFVEPGESLEETVAREVREEVGLAVPLAGIRYNSSQPWPFPASLMLGFHARAERAPLTVYQDELESALWVSREKLLGLGDGDEIRLPRKDSIARRLIEDWLAEG